MSWPESAQFYDFNEFSIVLHSKPQYGVYGVFDAARKPMLIDTGEVMLDLIRLVETGNRPLRSEPAWFSYVVAPYEEAQGMKRKLITELMPTSKRVARASTVTH